MPRDTELVPVFFVDVTLRKGEGRTESLIW